MPMRQLTIIKTQCSCGAKGEIFVNSADEQDWRNGRLAQNAFPYLSRAQREQLITGICPGCWNKIFEEVD
jgi:hypothetical protein